MGMFSVPVAAGAASAAGSAAGAGAVAVVAESAGLSLGWQPASAMSANAVLRVVANDFACIAELRGIGRTGIIAESPGSKQLVCLEVALEIAVAVVAAGIFHQVARGAQPVLRRRHQLAGGTDQVVLRDLAFLARLEVFGEHVFLGAFHERVDVGAGELLGDLR